VVAVVLVVRHCCCDHWGRKNVRRNADGGRRDTDVCRRRHSRPSVCCREQHWTVPLREPAPPKMMTEHIVRRPRNRDRNRRHHRRDGRPCSS